MADEWTLKARAVLIDMDGTIVDSTAVVEGVWAVFAQRYGLDLEAILATAHGRQTEPTVREFGPPGIDVQAVSDELAALELERIDGIDEVAGAADFVRPLVDAGLISLVTSSPRELAVLRMQGAGIEFPRVSVCAEDVVSGKPNPECYLKAAAALDVQPQDVVVFEDADAGVAAALAAGCQVVVVGGLNSPRTEGLPHINDFLNVTYEIVDEADGARSVLVEIS